MASIVSFGDYKYGTVVTARLLSPRPIPYHNIVALDRGASSLAGVAVIIIMIPVTKTVAQWMGRLQRNLMTSKDKRVEVNR